MSLFGKKTEEKSCCCQSTAKTTQTGSKDALVKVLGSGCKSCHQLYENAKEAVSGTDIDVEYITDLQRIMEYGAMSMPALVVNGEIVSGGRVLKPADIKKLIGVQ